MRSTRSTAISTSAPGRTDLFSRYFGLNEALAALFGRKVDLVMPGGMVNPYFIDSVNDPGSPFPSLGL